MKRSYIPLTLLVFLLTLTSCDAIRMVARSPAAIKNYFFSDGKPSYDSREDETRIDPSEETFSDTETVLLLPETHPEPETELFDAAVAELTGDLEFYTFDNGGAVLIFSEEGAWVIDHKENRAVSVFDMEGILETADPLGRGGEYFDEPRLSLTLEERASELKITFSVTSESEGAELRVYGFYTFSPIAGLTRGFRGYFPDMAVFPGSDDPATIYDIAEYEALGIPEDTYVYKVAAALATGDIDALSEILYLDPYVTAAWRSVKVGEYSITRTDFSANWYPELYVYVDITESSLDKLPAGKYRIRVSEGYSSAGFDFERLDGEVIETSYDVSDVNTPLGFVYTYAMGFGGGYHPDDMTTENASYSHSLLDFYTVIAAERGSIGDYDEFREFLLTRFGIEDADQVCTYKDFYNHGGHGLSTALCEIDSYVVASGIHVITVDFFADPMKTVVAFTQEYTLVENDGDFTLDSVERTYDSGVRSEGWTL